MLEVPEARATDKVTMHGIVSKEDTLGNQQERLVAQARLAMLFDCEGWISIYVLQRSKIRPFDMALTIGFNNTSRELIEWAASTLESLEVPHYVWWAKAPHGIGKIKQGRVLINGFK